MSKLLEHQQVGSRRKRNLSSFAGMDVLGVIQKSSSREQWCGILQRALEYAVCNNERCPIPALMDSIAKSNLEKAYVVEVLCTAIQCGHYPSFKKILECGADTAVYVNWKNDTGQTMIHVAAVHGRPASIRLLISKGSDVNAKDSDGNIALFLAVKHRRLLAMVAVLDSKPNLGLQYEHTKTTVVNLAAQRGVLLQGI